MKTFDDCGRVDEISPAQHAHEVRIELGDLYSGRAMHFDDRKAGKGEGGGGRSGREGDRPARKEKGEVKRRRPFGGRGGRVFVWLR